MDRASGLRYSAAAGMLGPLLFTLALTGLTLLQANFLRSLGWHPLWAATLDWPSGLALGPYGWAMTAAFVLNGLCILAFGCGLRQVLRNSAAGRWGARFLILAGLAGMALACAADPTLRQAPATWHGRLHDGAYVLLGAALCAGLPALALAFQREAHWRSLSRGTWLALGLTLPAFVIKGLAIYLVLGVWLVWSEAAAWRLWTAAAPGRQNQ